MACDVDSKEKEKGNGSYLSMTMMDIGKRIQLCVSRLTNEIIIVLSITFHRPTSRDLHSCNGGIHNNNKYNELMNESS